MAISSETENRVLRVIAANVAEIMPNVDASAVSIDGRLADYGCNSIDRADIVWKTLEDLQLEIPVVEFSGVSDIRGLTELLCRHLEAR
nr:hypothetical protein [uncultured bacterium]